MTNWEYRISDSSRPRKYTCSKPVLSCLVQPGKSVDFPIFSTHFKSVQEGKQVKELKDKVALTWEEWVNRRWEETEPEMSG